MQKMTLAIFLIIGLVLTAPAGAQIYRYIDENGQKRWTDDLSQIPEEQRASAQRVETIEGIPAGADAVEETSPPETDQPATEEQESTDIADVSREALEQEKAELDAIYQELLDERNGLEQMRNETLSATDQEALNEKISAYNAKTEQYETRLNAFNQKINLYNQKITSTNASSKGTP